MKTDIYQKIQLDFDADFRLAIEQLESLDATTKGMLEDRLIRAIVFLSEGDINRFKQLIELSRTDYRDVLWQAEYDGGEKQLYDFNRTFYELGLLKKGNGKA